MVVVAIYKGTDGLKEYKSGKTYELIFQSEHPGCVVVDRSRVADDGTSGGSLLKYVSMRKFLDNWEVTK